MTSAPLDADVGRPHRTRPAPDVAVVTRLAARDVGLVDAPRPVDLSQGTLALDLDAHPGMPRTPELRIVTGGQPQLEAWAARFAQAVVEVLSGDRPVSQLVRCTTARVHADLTRRTAALNRAVSPEQRRRRLRAQVRSVHLSCPSAQAAEVTIHLRQGQRSRAIAARLEIRDDRWTCVVLEFV